MSKHYGQLVEYIVRKKGYSLSDLAKELNINRRTIYNWFQTNDLKRDMIYRIGYIIKHDFSKEFPEIFTTEDFSGIYATKKASNFTLSTDSEEINKQWMEKYISLLEKYNKALITKLSDAERILIDVD